MNWERTSTQVMRSPEGYRVLRYEWSDGKRHFEAWAPSPRWVQWPDVVAMLGICKTAKAAMSLCEQHAKGKGDAASDSD